jgi:hypothetical protein
MYRFKCYIIAKNGGKVADFYYDSHILGSKLQAYLFDPTTKATDAGTLEDLNPNEYIDISPEIIEDVPNL